MIMMITLTLSRELPVLERASTISKLSKLLMYLLPFKMELLTLGTKLP